MHAFHWLAGSSSRQPRPLIGETIFDVQAWSEKLYLLSRCICHRSSHYSMTEMLPPYCAAQCHIFPSIKTLEPHWICCPMVWLVMAVPRLKLCNYNTNIGAKLRRLRRLTHDSVWGDLDGSVSGGEQACVLLVKISHHPRTWHVLRANSSLNL